MTLFGKLQYLSPLGPGSIREANRGFRELSRPRGQRSAPYCPEAAGPEGGPQEDRASGSKLPPLEISFQNNRRSDPPTGSFSRTLVGPPGGTGSLTSGPEVCPESSRGSAWLSASSLAVPPEGMLPSSAQAPKCSPLPSCWHFTPQTSSPFPGTSQNPLSRC